MGDALLHTKMPASLAALLLAGCLAGCGSGQSTTPGPSATVTSDPSVSRAHDATPTGAASPNPSASGDWWPEHPKTMATGQKFPEDYEPATLEHPARNVPKPQFPEAAKQETEEGAQAFLDYHSDAQWYSLQTGNTSLVREITSPSCEVCARQFDETEEVYRLGFWAVGGLEKLKIIPGSFHKGSNGVYTIPVHVDDAGVKIIEHNRVAIEQEPIRSTDEIDVTLDHKNGEWIYITASPRGEL